MNNFDMSSSGVNIELNVYYDNDLSSIFFDENISMYKYNGYGYNDFALGFFIDGGCYERPETYADLIDTKKAKKRDLQAFASNFGYDYDKTYTKQDFINLFEEKELKNAYRSEIIELLSSDFALYHYNEVYGYSQGDYALVITKDEVKNSYLRQLFYDSPISGILKIDDDEYNIDEMLKDYYEYDSDEIMDWIKKNIEHPKKDYILDWLVHHLPTNPDYR